MTLDDLIGAGRWAQDHSHGNFRPPEVSSNHPKYPIGYLGGKIRFETCRIQWAEINPEM
jgi:hypothetical protein